MIRDTIARLWDEYSYIVFLLTLVIVTLTTTIIYCRRQTAAYAEMKQECHDKGGMLVQTDLFGVSCVATGTFIPLKSR